MSEQKDYIRSEALRHRNLLQIEPDWAEEAARHILETLKPQPGATVALYYPKDKEIDTIPLAEALWTGGVTVALPLIDDDPVLRFVAWNKGAELQNGKFNIPVPAELDFVSPDIVIVPLLVFDQQGHRVGYGKGYYDATLKYLREQKAITAVGYAYAEQACLFALPREDHDEKLDLVVTPQRVFDFRR